MTTTSWWKFRWKIKNKPIHWMGANINILVIVSKIFFIFKTNQNGLKPDPLSHIELNMGSFFSPSKSYYFYQKRIEVFHVWTTMHCNLECPPWWRCFVNNGGHFSWNDAGDLGALRESYKQSSSQQKDSSRFLSFLVCLWFVFMVFIGVTAGIPVFLLGQRQWLCSVTK